eukprot:scaffold6133_cov55-Cylindrotheca_fusiformis.AAC.1
MRESTLKLEVTLGPDTADLELRWSSDSWRPSRGTKSIPAVWGHHEYGCSNGTQRRAESRADIPRYCGLAL